MPTVASSAMPFAGLFVLLFTSGALASCAAAPAEELVRIRGHAIASEPLRGAEVTLWQIDEKSGQRRPTPVGSARTDERGYFVLSAPIPAQWPPEALELVVQDVASDAPKGTRGAHPGRGSELVATLTGLTPGSERWWVKVTPITTLATALSRGRLTHPRKEEHYTDAARTAYALIGDHFGDVSPAGSALLRPEAIDISARSPTTPARHTLVLGGLSELAADFAARHEIGARPPLAALTAMWARDLAGPEARFCTDSEPGTPGALPVGCSAGASAAREGLADSILRYAQHIAGDRDLGRGVLDVAEDIRTNGHPELFGGESGRGAALRGTGYEP